MGRVFFVLQRIESSKMNIEKFIEICQANRVGFPNGLIDINHKHDGINSEILRLQVKLHRLANQLRTFCRRPDLDSFESLNKTDDQKICQSIHRKDSCRNA